MARKWTDEQRLEHSNLIKKLKPWEKSTGPKTSEGKSTSSQNAYKHGFRSRDFDAICKILREQKTMIESVL